MTNQEIEDAQEIYLNLRKKLGIPVDNAFCAGAEYARDLVKREVVVDILSILKDNKVDEKVCELIKNKYIQK